MTAARPGRRHWAASLVALGRFDPFATTSGNGRFLREIGIGLTLHEIVRLLFSFFNELQLQGI